MTNNCPIEVLIAAQLQHIDKGKCKKYFLELQC